ncbi:SpaA isopeptide-forming pilin-related protein [Marmoricola sp. RAF53]|uniref:SpaA isopeptide-forming pilin-related protein n=1 Tax=Marmoricola sp. RAF53 TaxID=3233059 RepID=UPI003F95A49E
MNNRRVRITASVAAAAVAALLALGPTPALADDAPVDPGAAAAEAPADSGTPADPASEAPAPAPAEPAPAEHLDDAPPPADTAKADDPAPQPEQTDAPATAPGAPSTPRTRTFAASALAPVVNALAIACTGGPNPVVGGFEIDGNTCVQGGGLDWDTTGSMVEDGFGDSTGFTGGSSENDPPTSWSIGGSPNGKSDIGTAWAHSRVSGGQVYGFFAITNDSTSGGTSQYDLEYNQLGPTTNGGGKPVPNRSPGDLLFRFSSTGSAAIVFSDAKKYTLTSSPSWSNGSCFAIKNTAAGWCTIPIPSGVFAQQVNSDGTFFEGAINISLLFGAGNCSGSFGSTSIRSVTGNSFATSALQDYVTPLGVSTPSTCGKLVINKQDLAGNPIGLATFSVSPNPDPTLPDGTPYSIKDNDAKDKYPAVGVIEISPVDPDESYTVTETDAPAGYLLASPASQGPVQVDPSEIETVTFKDPKRWKPLTATKTAVPSYTATYGWSIDKQVSANGVDGWKSATKDDEPLVKNVPGTDPNANQLYYRVAVTEGARTTSAHQVTGNIYVTNPNAAAVTADLSDDLPGATCTVAGSATKEVAVPPGGPTPYPYVCTFDGIPADGGTNTAHVTWDRSAYPQEQSDLLGGDDFHVDPTAGYTFGAETTAVDKTVTITDDHHVFPGGWTITWNPNDGTVNTSPVYSSTVDVTPGTCSAVLKNTARVLGAGQTEITQDSAYGKVCEGADLSITRVDARGFTRTYPWSVEKKTTTPKVTVDGGKATAHYQVTVTAGDGLDSDWVMTGTITVHNPNAWEAVALTSLPVTYSGGGSCTATGPFPASVPAGGSRDFPYTCNFGGVKPGYTGTISAVANWNAATAATPSDHATSDLGITEANWKTTLVNSTVVLHDDNTTPADTSDDQTWDLAWDAVHALPGGKKVIEYDIEIPNLPDGGTCGNRDNVVKIVGDGGASLDADKSAANNTARVQVCNPLGLSIARTAVGDFTRTYPWTIQKFIDGDKTSQKVDIDSYQHTFDYLVKVTPGTPVDSAWKVSGTVTVTNDNTDAGIDPISLTGVQSLPNIGTGGTCTYAVPGLLPLQIVSGDHVDIGFECTFANQPTKPYAGTLAASATWGQSGSASTPAGSISWHAPAEVDKSIAVYDDKTDGPDGVLLGNVAWNENGTSTTFPYALKLSVPEETAGSCGPDFVNTAWLGGDGSEPTDRQDSTTATICVNAGTWTVAKENVDGDGPIAVGTDVTYRLTAHKTAGVDPKNVVVKDDLSALVPSLDGDPQFTAPDGSTAEYDPATHVLTWTIAQLGATDATMEFTVHVADDAYGVDLPNLVTSPGSTNCPDAEVAAGVEECTTDNDTPSYTLEKSSSVTQGGEVLPPYLGAPGTTITYTLTVHNDSDAPINPTTLPDATVVDDLSKVVDDAELLTDSIDPADQAAYDAATKKLTWTLPPIAAGDTVQLSYQVRVRADRWDETLTNVAVPGDGGTCLVCTTTAVTPPSTKLSVLKVDFETGERLAGAEFALFHGEDKIATATSGEDGVAVFDVALLPGSFTVTETKAPAGYALPVEGEGSVTVVVDDENFVAGGVMEPITFRDPATGQIAILTKEDYERDPVTNGWVLSDGAVDFGDEIRYVVHVKATGTKLFHDVTVKDYVPGFNPLDTTSTGKGVLVAGSSTCTGALTCTSTEDAVTGLVTWKLTTAGQEPGDVRGDATGAVEFVVRMPELPDAPDFGVSGVYSRLLWNVGYLDWDELDFSTPPSPPQVLGLRAARALAVGPAHHSLTSNEVTDEARAIEPAAPVVVVDPPGSGGTGLPNTGGPDLWILLLGLGLTLVGGTVVLGGRIPRRRS